MTYVRRYNTDPGQAELLAIEGIVIIDGAPPGQINGVGSGFAVMIAEMEDGPFGIPIEADNGNDVLTTFGGFGFTYGGIPSCNPCARARFADGQLLAEYWNGNGFIALVNKTFSRLAIVRVDTTVGSVSLTPLASVLGNGNFEWALTSGQHIDFDIGAGTVASTFTGVAATKASSAGSFPTGFAGGEHIQFTIDANTPQQIGPIDLYFTAAAQSQAQCVAQLNAAAGYAAFSVGGAGVTNFVGRVQGTSGNVQINAQDAAVGTKLGFATTITNGTGNVTNIAKVKFSEFVSVVQGALAGSVVDRDSNNNLRVSATSAVSITVVATTTAAAFGFTPAATDANTVTTTGVIPAGTRVRNGGGTEWVTAQSFAVTAGQAGPFSIKVRPAVDDGTTAGANAGTVTTFAAAIPGDSYSVTNPLPLNAALTEPALDAAYAAAFDTTLSPNAITRQANIVFSARQSNALRMKTRSNVLAASKSLFGRVSTIRPPLNTKRADAKSTVTQPGVGAYRAERVIYNYPGVNTNVPQIATRGVSGGAGFTFDGNLDVGSQSWVASVMSQLAPEENPGQLTSLMSLVNSLEVGNADVQNMDITDYIAFKAAGIAALQIDDGNAVIQSGVTSVDPLVDSGLVNISRRRMADFCQDSMAISLKPFAKKKATKSRRSEVYGLLNGFLNQLQGSANESNQRIDSYVIDAKSGNTKDSLAAGLYRLIIRIRLLPEMDVIVLQTTIGENVDTSQQVIQLAA